MLYGAENAGPSTMEPTSTSISSYFYDDYDDYGNDSAQIVSCDMSHNRSASRALQSYVHPVISALGAAGNGLVVLTYALYKRARSTTDVYLLHMAASDLLLAAALPLIAYNERWSWPMGTAACKLLRGAYSVNLFGGMLLLACISGDRYLAVVHARRFHLRSAVCSRVVCGAVWLLAVAFSLPTFLFYQAYAPSHRMIVTMPGEEEEEEAEEEEAGAVAVCDMLFSDAQTARYMRVLVPASQLVLGFLLPLVVMLCCYCQVLARLLRANTFQRHRAVRVVLAVLAVFLLCHLPYSVTLLCHTLDLFHQRPCEWSNVLRATLTATETVAYLHCCLNPLLYAFLGVRFRNNLKKVLRDLWCVSGVRGRAPPGRSLSSRATSDSFISSRRSVTSASFEI